jgi:transcriptional regulator with XRE-family HTH domain
MAKSTLKDRLLVIMRAEGWSQAQLARVAGCSRQAVTNWMIGDNLSMDPRFAFNIQDKSASRFNARWTLYNEGPQRMDIVEPAEARMLESIRNLPKDKKAALAVVLKP